MGRSVKELRLESERNRAALTATVDQLREQLHDTAEDLRQKASAQHIKAELSDYISDKSHGWLGSLKQHAMDNPLQAVAAGTAIAVPTLRLARSFPLPLLMIAAGLALTSKTVRGRAAEATGPALNKAGKIVNQGAEAAQGVVSGIKDTLSSALGQANDLANDATRRAGSLADDLSVRASRTTKALNDNISSGFNERVRHARSTAEDTIDAARSTATAAPEMARQMVGGNAALIGGIGVAIGAVIAAALPKTKAEETLMSGAGAGLKETAQSGFAALKEKAMSAADAMTKSVADSDLGAHTSRITQNVVDSLKEAVEDVGTAALNPSRNPNN
jgi:hypothetical protein